MISCVSRAAVPVLHLDAEVDADSAGAIVEGIALAAATHAKAVVLVIDSPGGEISAGFKLAKVIESSPVPVVCVVDGDAASMAGYILESCPVRFMTKRSKLMFHEPAMGMPNAAAQQTAWRSYADWLKAETESMAEHLCRRSKVKPETLLERIRGGAMWWLTWKEAQADGFVDGVVETATDVIVALEQ